MFLCLAVFLYLNYRNKSFGNIAESFRARVKGGDICIVVLLGGVLICSFLLVQAASVDIFAAIGIQGNSGDVKIANFYEYIQ